MTNINKETINYFQNVGKKLKNIPPVSVLTNQEGKKSSYEVFQKNKVRLSKTDEEARMNARIDNMITGKTFDESETPDKELINLDEKLIDTLINRELKDILS